MADKTKSALVLRDFKDAGTGERFTADDTVQLEEGVFINYEAAGLVRAADEPKAKSSAPAGAGGPAAN